LNGTVFGGWSITPDFPAISDAPTGGRSVKTHENFVYELIREGAVENGRRIILFHLMSRYRTYQSMKKMVQIL